MSFVCDECEKEFRSQQNLDYHIFKKACKISTCYCKYCNKGFTAKTNMYTHIRNSCREKKKEDDDRENILERLVKLEEKNKQLEKDHEEIEKLKKQNKKIVKENEKLKKIVKIDNSIKTNNINNGTINNNNNNLNVILVGYGKEDMSKINKNDMLKILQYGYDSTLHLTNRVHFNPELPEYNNIYISNMKDKFAMMFDGKDWILTMKEDLIQKIYDDKRSYIETNLDDFVNSLTKDRINALKRWLDTADDHPRIKKIKDDITLMLYNKRRIAIDQTIKITDNMNQTNKEIENVLIDLNEKKIIKPIKKQTKQIKQIKQLKKI
jgi:hypothetical protein